MVKKLHYKFCINNQSNKYVITIVFKNRNMYIIYTNTAQVLIVSRTVSWLAAVDADSQGLVVAPFS